MLDKEMWREEMGIWLEPFAWDWFCSLTFRPGLTEKQCWWRLRRWLNKLKDELGTPHFGWFAVREFGRTGQDLHFHVLITGLTDPGAANRMEFMRLWAKLAGDGRVDLYVRNPRGISYILKNTTPDDPGCYEFELSDSSKLDAVAGAK